MAGNYEAGELIATMALDVSELNQSASKVSSIMEGMGGKMDTLAAKLSRLETAYSTGATMMSNSMKALAEAQEKANSAMLRKEQSMNTHLKNISDNAKTTKNYTEAVKENTQTIKENSDSIVTNARNISKTSQQAATALKHINDVHFGNAIAGIVLVSETVESLAKRLVGANGAFERLARTIRTSIGNASSQATKDIEGLAKAVASLEAVSSRGFGKLGRINTSQLKEAQAQTALLRRELQALHNMPTNVSRGGGAGSLGSSFRSARGEAEGLMGTIRNLSIDIFFLQYAAQNLGSVFQTVFGKGIGFAAEMETDMIGIAAIIQSTMNLNGEAMTFADANAIAAQSIETLKKAALSTNLTLKELVKTFQAIIGPAANMGLTIKQTADLAVIGGTAVKTLGLKEDQLVQEIRSMLTGNITARSSTLATSLGLTNADIENAVNSAEGLFEFLKKRMAGFEMASRESGNTLMGIWSNIMDGVEQTQEKAYMGLFAVMKQELAKIQDLFFDIQRYKKGEKVDENGQDHEGEIKEAHLNEDTVARFTEVANLTMAIYASIKDWAVELSNNTQLMGMISRFANSIAYLFEAIFNNAESIVQCLAIVWAASGGWLRIVVSVLAYMDALPEVIEWIADNLNIVFGVFVLVEGIIPGICTLLLAMNGNVGTVLKTCNLLYIEIGKVAAKAIVAAEAFLMAQSAGVVAFSLIAVAAIGAAIAIGGIIASILYLFYLLHLAKQQTNSSDRNKLSNAAGSPSIEMEGGMVPGSEQQQEMYEDPLLKNSRENKSPFDVPGKPSWFGNETSFQKYMREASERSKSELAKIEELNNRRVEGAITNKYTPEGGKAKKEQGGKGDSARDALNEISERYKLERQLVKEGLEDLEFLHKENLVAVEDYYDKKLVLQRQSINYDIAELKEKKAVATKQSDITKYEGEIALKNQALARLDVTSSRERAVALRELTTEINKYYHAILIQKGEGSLAAREAFDEKNRKILSQIASELDYYKGLTKEGKQLSAEELERKKRIEAVSEELKNQRIDLTAIGNLTAAIANAERARKKIDNDALEKSIQMQALVAKGAMSEFEYKRKSFIVDNEKAEALKKQLEIIEREMQIIGPNGDWKSATGAASYEDARKKVLELRKAILDLEHPFDYITTTVMGAFKDSMEDAFSSLITRTKKVSDAFKDMAKAILASLAKLMANKLATSILAGFMGGGAYTPATANASLVTRTINTSGWSSAFNHADGGFIRGPGTGTSDSILSRLSNGEYVIRADSVARIGLPMLEHLNQYGTLPRLAYASGGAVGTIASSSGSSEANGGIGKLKIEIINNSGNQLKVNSADVSFDLTETVLSIVVDGVTRNVGDSQTILASALRSAR